MTQPRQRNSSSRMNAVLVLWMCAVMCALCLSAPAFAQDQPSEPASSDEASETDADDNDSDSDDFEEEEESNLVTAEPLKEGESKIEWFPGWEVGARAGWLFTSLDALNPTVNEPNGGAPYDAVGVMRLEAFGGTYVSKGFMIRGFGGGAFNMGGDASWSAVYGGIDPALVFAEHRFEFLLGLRAGFGGYTMSMNAADGSPGPIVSEGGYEGAVLILEPYLNYRHMVTMGFAVDLSFGFWQTFTLTDNATGDAQDVDSIVGQPQERPLDWVAPNITLGFVFGEMPTRPERPLDPNGDKDDDGIINKDDKCVDEAEDEDGFEDEDGCPDKDNDQDGVEDSKDKCVDEAEDKDGVMDEDGCPETDGDGDKILDEADKCPNDPEDMDGFEDTDGCPDTDNDQDGVPDAVDKCPNSPEDKDGKNDEDGCPDLDDDQDWIIDPNDKCPEQAEVWNGVDDTDGCPEEDKGMVYLDGKNLKTRLPLFFPSTMRDIDKNIKDHLDRVAAILKSAPHIKVILIEVHTDDSKKDADASRKWSGTIAKAMRAYLTEKGVGQKRVLISGKGADQPVMSTEGLRGNEKRKAQAANRRIVFKVLKLTPAGEVQ